MLRAQTRSAAAQRAVKVKSSESVVLLPANGEARGRRIQNDDATATLYLGLGLPAELHKDIAIAPGATWDGRLGPDDLWAGAVNGINSGAGETVALVVETE